MSVHRNGSYPARDSVERDRNTSKSWGICQVIDIAKLVTTTHNTTGLAIHREVAMTDRRLENSEREKPDDHRWNGVLLGMSACGRCGGLMTRDEEFSLSIDRKMPSLRCIQCGEWLDEIILRNRVVSRRRETPNRQQTVRM